MDIADKHFQEIMNDREIYSKAVGTIRSEVDDFMVDFHDDPASRSRWGHQYFCDEDGERLGFDPHEPSRHMCPVCHKAYVGEPYDGVWVYFYRNMAIVTALKAATVYRAIRDPRYLSHAKRILSFYAENYTKFVLHNKEDHLAESYDAMEWGCGRIMPQGLNESIICIRMIMTMLLLDEELDGTFKRELHDSLFVEMCSLLKPQVRAIHNISCWNLVALGAIGLYFDDRPLLDFVFGSKFGIRNQLAEGVTKDGFWYEGSIHYNYFLLEGLSTLLLFCDAYGYDFGTEEKRIVHDMLANGYAYAFDNQFFPNPNDGWPSINLKTFGYVYHMAAKVFGEQSDIGNILKNIEAHGGERTRLPLSESYYVDNIIPLERLLFTCGFDFGNYERLEGKPYAYPDSNFVMLRNGPLNVFLKYGLNGPSHAHPDIMQVEIAYGDLMVSRDLSNAGYRSRLCNAWHRTTLGHDTVVANGKNIPSTERGTLLSFTGLAAEAVAHDVYPGIDYRRSLQSGPCGLEDFFSVDAREQGVFDYVFHLEPEFSLDRTDLATEPAALGFDGNGYGCLWDVGRVLTDGAVLTVVARRPGLEISITFDLGAGKRLFVCKSLDNPVDKTRTTFIVRSNDAHPRFRMKLDFSAV
jgi:hypothetical protein